MSIGPNRSGLVHISEISPYFVSDVNDFLTIGQEVTVKVIGVDERGRINLSIKQAGVETPPPPPRRNSGPRPRPAGGYENRSGSAQPRDRGPNPRPAERQTSGEASPVSPPELTPEEAFEDKLKRFMKDSDSRISGVKQYADMKKGRRRRG